MDLTSGFLGSSLGTVTVSTPFSMDALICSGLVFSGSRNLRRNLPLLRSTRCHFPGTSALNTCASGVSFQSMRAPAKAAVSEEVPRGKDGKMLPLLLLPEPKGKPSKGSQRSREKGSNMLLRRIIDIVGIAANLEVERSDFSEKSAHRSKDQQALLRIEITLFPSRTQTRQPKNSKTQYTMSLIRRSNVFDPFSLDLWDPFDGFPFGSGSGSLFPRANSDAAASAGARIDWKETPEAHVFKADVPGLKKEEVKVEVEDGNVLQISGERIKEQEEKTDKFRLPENTKPEQIKASMENGVLTVTVPKEEPKKPDVKSIQITG
uniref:Uncharacterized protein n=1 Tax=Oryza glumipatula TaxID=40148 RepID=A0A0D9Z548_9ORYZ